MESMVADDVARQIFARYEVGELIVSCAWCSRVALDDDWQRPPRSALAAIDLLTLSHGVCPTCQVLHFPDDG
jgi:hypothetical protein